MLRCKKGVLLGLLGLVAMAGAAVAAPDISAHPELRTPASKAIPVYQMAQLNLSLGLSERDARRVLTKNGYREIRITRTSFKNVHAEACLDGDRFKIKVRRLSGEIVRGEFIGKCRRTYDAQGIAAQLRKQGLDRINVSAAGQGNFIASACDYKLRVRLKIDPYGDVLHRAVKGRCQRGLNVAEIQRQLQEDGFTRIQMVKKNQGRLVVEACFEEDKVRLRLGPNGHIRQHDYIGTCARPISSRNIAKRLVELGYRQIKIIDSDIPIFKAEACKQKSLVAIRMNRYGEVISTSRLGRCLPPLSSRQIVQMLKRRGAHRIKILSQDTRGFSAAACYKLERRQYKIDLYGAILDRKVIGKCLQAPRLSSLLKEYRSRGMKDLRFFIEACRRGRRLQIELDRFGDEISTRRIGRC